MKVFFVLDTLINAGTEKSVLAIIKNFSKLNDVTVLYFYPRHDLKSDFIDAGIKLHFLGLEKNDPFIFGIFKLKRIIQMEKPDIVVSSIYRANIIARLACFFTNTKLVGTFVSDSYSKERESVYSIKRRVASKLFWFIDRITAFIPVAWISNSNCIKISNSNKLGINLQKIKVIYRGRDGNAIKEWAPLSNKKNFDFIYTGRILRSKGIKELLEAFLQVSKRYPNIRLHFYGDGDYTIAIKKFIKLHFFEEKILLHGVVNNSLEKLLEADCFVFPSWYEGFSGALVEAMFTGMPIIASDIAMNLEAITDGQSAVTHKSRDIKSIEQAMYKVIEAYDESIKMGKEARKIAFERFEIKTIAESYEGFLKRVVKGKKYFYEDCIAGK